MKFSVYWKKKRKQIKNMKAIIIKKATVILISMNFILILIENLLLSISFYLQYRAAVSSSLHSTPSKSFVANNSSPHSTVSNSSSRQNSPNHSINSKCNINNNLSPQSLPPHAYALQQKQRSFLTFGFGAGSGSGPSRRESHVNVNVTPTSHDATSDTPEIRKYKKRFNSEILCAALWGVNLLIGTENGLMLLDRSGQGKVIIYKIKHTYHKKGFKTFYPYC